MSVVTRAKFNKHRITTYKHKLVSTIVLNQHFFNSTLEAYNFRFREQISELAASEAGGLLITTSLHRVTALTQRKG